MCAPTPPNIDHDLGKKASNYAKQCERELDAARESYRRAFERYAEAPSPNGLALAKEKQNA